MTTELVKQCTHKRGNWMYIHGRESTWICCSGCGQWIYCLCDRQRKKIEKYVVTEEEGKAIADVNCPNYNLPEEERLRVHERNVTIVSNMKKRLGIEK